MRNVWASCLNQACEHVKHTGTKVGEIAERGKRIFSAGSEKIAAHPRAKNDERTHGQENGQRAAPHFLQPVTESGDGPSRDTNQKSQNLAAVGSAWLRVRGL